MTPPPQETSHQDKVFDYFDNLMKQTPGDNKRIDTHANIVFLIGDTAYKIKRAVKFPFLDYSTLEKRAAACQSEIACNQANAPSLYRSAFPLMLSSNGKVSRDGTGELIEWVVEMGRFDGSKQLDLLAQKGPLSPDLCDRLARMMLQAHACAPVRREAGPAFFEELESYVGQNKEAFTSFPELFDPGQAADLNLKAKKELARIKPLILSRAQAGHVRRCHGDAHTRNIVLIENEPVLFDAIEFSEAMATTDTLYDLAFLLMDLWEQGQHRAANLIFNRYFDRQTLATGPQPEKRQAINEESLSLLPFYLMMRACIRAKIAAAAAENQEDQSDRIALQKEAKAYFAMAQDFIGDTTPNLLAIGGLSGSGKSTLARALAHRIGRAPGARILRTDIERKALLGLVETQKAPESAYAPQAAKAVYTLLDLKMRAILVAGHSVIFDAVFAREQQRQEPEEIAQATGAGFQGLWLDAPSNVLTDRVSSRTGDASDADDKVVAFQLSLDHGTITWPKIDASQTPEATLKAAEEALGL